METIELLGSTLGLGFVAGIRLYATILALGLIIRFHLLHLGAIGQPLEVLAHPAVLTTAAIAYLAEFFADKIPWLDSAWDSFHTFIRPLGAVVLAAAALGHINPVLRLVLIILSGGVALASHSSKTASRLLVNHSPEPVTNIAISLLEDALAPVGIWLSIRHPLIMLTLVAIFIGVFLWIAPVIFRATRLQLVGLKTWFLPSERKPVDNFYSHPILKAHPHLEKTLYTLASHAEPLPKAHARAEKGAPQQEIPIGVRVAATKSISGLNHSIGYLILGSDDLAFVARRSFRLRTHRINLTRVVSAEWKRGVLMNRLILKTVDGEQVFYLFKDIDIRQTERTASRTVAADSTL